MTRPSFFLPPQRARRAAAVWLGATALFATGLDARAAPIGYADVGDGPFGSISWIGSGHGIEGLSAFDGAPGLMLSGQSKALWHSSADAAMSAAGSGSLFAGTLHARASADAMGARAPDRQRVVSIGGGSALWDHVRLEADAGHHFIPLTMRVDGDVEGFAGLKVRHYVGTGDPFLHFSRRLDQGWTTLAAQNNGAQRHWDTTFTLANLEASDESPGEEVMVYVEMEADAHSTSRTGGWADFSHTARLQWDLPEGVTVHSASGRFLAGPPAAVPEPASLGLALLGVSALLGGARPRRATFRHRPRLCGGSLRDRNEPEEPAWNRPAATRCPAAPNASAPSRRS